MCSLRPTEHHPARLLSTYSNRRNHRRRPRARSGSLVPLDEIECAIVLVLEDHCGEAKCLDVVRGVGDLLEANWTEADLEWMISGPRWESRVRSCGTKLRRDGVLAWRGVDWGVWRLAK